MILVTGGTGFIGRRVVTQLVASGHQVAVLSRSGSGDVPGARVVQGDLVNPGPDGLPLEGVDTIVHLAGVLRGDALLSINVHATRALALAAKRAGVRRFIHGSSAGVYGDSESMRPATEADEPRPATAYERSKLEGEHAVTDVLARDIPWVILRPSGVYGPGRQATLDLLRTIQRRRWWLHPPGIVILHPTYVDDLSAAVAAVVDRRDIAAEIINIGGERALPFPALIAAHARALGTSVRQVSLPAAVRQLAAASRRLGVSSARLDRLARSVINRGLDTSKATRLLGASRIPLEEGLATTVASFRAQGLL